jgi:hypothetical protein
VLITQKTVAAAADNLKYETRVGGFDPSFFYRYLPTSTRYFKGRKRQLSIKKRRHPSLLF